jgi:hypothetical protein
MITLSIQFPDDEFNALCDHLITSDLVLTEQHIKLKDTLANSVLTKEQIDNINNYLDTLTAEHRVVKALLNSCLSAKQQKLLTA